MLIIMVKAKIRPGKLQEFKEVIVIFEQRLSQNEPHFFGRVYLSQDETEATIFDIFEDEAAYQKHQEEHRRDPDPGIRLGKLADFGQAQFFGGPLSVETVAKLAADGTARYPEILLRVNNPFIARADEAN